MALFVCEQCGQSFETEARGPKKKPPRFCNRLCASAWFKDHPRDYGRRDTPTPTHPHGPLICGGCKASFYASSPTNRFCSVRCRGVHIGKNRPGRPSRIERICKACGKTFTRPPCQVDHGAWKGDYCSNKCKGVLMGDLRRGKPIPAEQRARQSATMLAKSPHQRQAEYVLQCHHCLSSFVLLRRDYQRVFKQRFCSRDCWQFYLREHPDESPLWRGGAESYYGPNWKEQAQRARERDEHTCQDCGAQQTNPALPVHHLRPRRLFDGDYLAANALDNLITLCPVCHGRREAIDPQQWRAYKLYRCQRLRHGEANSSAKLTDADVAEIRRIHAAGDGTCVAIGRRFGVSGVAVSLIVRRKTWQHLP